jgi:subtilisin family serine protease
MPERFPFPLRSRLTQRRWAYPACLAALLNCSSVSNGEEVNKLDPAVKKDLSGQGVARVIVFTQSTSSATGESGVAYISRMLPADASKSISQIDNTSTVVVGDQKAIEALSSDPGITKIIKDVADPPALIDTTRIISADKIWNIGYSGKGYAIAVLDTGVDAQHPFLKGAVSLQACFSVQDDRLGYKSLCPGGGRLSTGDVIDTSANSAVPCKIQGCQHGTHVAGIAVGRKMELPGQPGKVISGVANSAGLIAVQIFSEFTNPSDCPGNAAPCIKAFRSSQLRALNYVHSKQLTHISTGDGPDVAAINMSIAADTTGSPCDRENPLFTRRISALRDDGVATFVAAGNEGNPLGVDHPACISSAISVGALEKNIDGQAERFAAFSDLGDGKLISIFTVGKDVTSSVPGGGFISDSGTSMATPVAAGSYTVLKSAFPNATVDQIEKALQTSGPKVRDPFNDLMLPAIGVQAAFTSLKTLGLVAAAAETTAPTPPTEHTGEAAAAASAQSNPGSSDASGTRFIVETPAGQTAEQSSSAVVRASGDLSKALNVDSVTSAPIGSDGFTISTGKAVKIDDLKRQLEEHVGHIGAVQLDLATPLPSNPK